MQEKLLVFCVTYDGEVLLEKKSDDFQAKFKTEVYLIFKLKKGKWTAELELDYLYGDKYVGWFEVGEKLPESATSFKGEMWRWMCWEGISQHCSFFYKGEVTLNLSLE